MSPKPLLLLKGKEVLIYSLEVFDRCDLVEGVVVVAPPERVDEFERVIKKYSFKKSIQSGWRSKSLRISEQWSKTSPNQMFDLC